MDYTDINKLFLKRNNLYREYIQKFFVSDSKENFEETVKELLDDANDDITTWNETLRNSDFQVPTILEKTWDNLYKNICYTINLSANIKTLKGF